MAWLGAEKAAGFQRRAKSLLGGLFEEGLAAGGQGAHEGQFARLSGVSRVAQVVEVSGDSVHTHTDKCADTERSGGQAAGGA